MGSLPLPPNVPPPQLGGGGFVQPQQTPGLMPYKPSIPSQIIQGVQGFVDNYIQTKRSSQEYFRNKFYQGIQDKMLGIPVSDKELLKWSQKAGMKLATEEQSPEEKQYTDAQRFLSQQSGQLVPGLAGAQEAAAGVPPAPPQPAPGLGQMLLGKLKQAVGIYPQPSMQSPAAQWLQSLGGAVGVGGGMVGQTAREGEMANMKQALARVGIDAEKMSLQQQMALRGLGNQVIQGNVDPSTIQMLVRSGFFKDLPIDEFTMALKMQHPEASTSDINRGAGQLYQFVKMGGPQMNLAKFQMIEKLAPKFAGRMDLTAQYINDIFTKGTSNLTPAWSPEDFEKVMSGMAKMQEQYPTAPANVLTPTAIAAVTPGMGDFYKKGLDVLSNYSTRGSLELQKQQNQLGFDYASLAQRTENERGLLDLAKVQKIMEVSKDKGELWWKIMHDPNSSPDQVRAAARGLADAASKTAGLSINYQGSKFPVGDPMSVLDRWSWKNSTWVKGYPQFYTPEPPDQVLGNLTPQGGPPGRVNPQRHLSYGDIVQQEAYKKRMAESLEGLSPEERSMLLQRSGNTQVLIDILTGK